MTLTEMLQKRATLTSSIRALMTEYEDKEMPGDKKTELAKLEADFDTLNGKILAEQKQQERERAAGEAADRAADKDPKAPKNKEIMDAFRAHLGYGAHETQQAYHNLTQDNPTQAGALVAPEQFVTDVIAELDNMLFVRRLCKVLPPLQSAQSLGFPKRTARMTRANWGTEVSAPTTDTTLAFGKREFKPNPASAEILISRTLMRNAPQSDTILRDEMAYMFGELEEIGFLLGTGAGQPLGLFTASADGISTARDIATDNTATAITCDGLINAKFSIKSQYQSRLQWIFHRDAVKMIAKLKDSTNNYIWQGAVTADQPDRLLGKPVNMSEYAPNTFTTGLYAGIIGDFNYYWIVDSLMMELQVLAELYARQNQIDYVARIETDGMPVVEEAFARVKLG